jgi:hypothetical protein
MKTSLFEMSLIGALFSEKMKAHQQEAKNGPYWNLVVP